MKQKHLFTFLFGILITSTAFAIKNPASQNCRDKGGYLETRHTLEDDEYNVCVWYNNLCGMYVRSSECEEWDLFLNRCSKGQCKKVDALYLVDGTLHTECLVD